MVVAQTGVWHTILPIYRNLMDLLLILTATLIGFTIFISSIYFIKKLIFPRLEDQDDQNYYGQSRKSIDLQANKKNPYSFSRDNR